MIFPLLVFTVVEEPPEAHCRGMGRHLKCQTDQNSCPFRKAFYRIIALIFLALRKFRVLVVLGITPCHISDSECISSSNLWYSKIISRSIYSAKVSGRPEKMENIKLLYFISFHAIILLWKIFDIVSVSVSVSPYLQFIKQCDKVSTRKGLRLSLDDDSLAREDVNARPLFKYWPALSLVYWDVQSNSIPK